MKNIALIAGIAGLIFLVGISCKESKPCSDCGGGITDGYLFKKVTEADIPELSSIDGIEIDNCIRFKFVLDETDFDLETVNIVDDCCCLLYE